MTLDDRGRRAADNLMNKVEQAPLLLMERGVPGTATPGRSSRLLSFAGAFAAVLVLVGVTLIQVDLFSPDSSTTSETFPVTVSTAPTTTTTRPPTTTTVTAPAPVAPTATTTTVTVPDDTPPLLTITYPKNGAVVGEKTLRFEGVTEPGAVVAAGPFQAEVKDDGQWAILLLLNEGGNLATFTATDPAGNHAEASVSVTYDPPAKPKPPEAAFTAHNKWGSCSESPPYDEFYGTGKPGTRVSIVSAYGSGSTTIAGNGEWYVKVFFAEAPYGKTFEVKAKDEFGNKVYFEFTSLVKK